MKRLSILALLVLAACSAERSLPALETGWQYALTNPVGTPPDDRAPWREHIEGDTKHDAWMRVRFPATMPDGTHLVFRAYVGELTLFVERAPVYSFRQPSSVGRLTLHTVLLPPGSAGKRLYVRIPHAPRSAFFGTAPLLASDESLSRTLDRAAFQPMRRSARNVIVGLILMIVAIAATGASMLRRRGDSLALLWLGLFTFLYGLRLAFDSFLPILFGVPLRTIDFAASFITYVISIPAWAVATRLLGPGWKSTLRYQVLLFALFAPIGILSDLLTGRPASLDGVNNVLVVLGGITILANSVLVRRKATVEVRIVLAGATLFFLFALNNNLAALHVLPWGSGDETIGFLIFIASLGFAAVRLFLRGEREQLALENELSTAREIQLSILPTSMPDLAGLRFHARYDPASSVAGDLYDFLRVDSRHVGVLVADVSGHGIPAALIASMVKIAVTSQARLAHDPAALLQEVSTTLRREVKRVFVTATYLFFDTEQRTVTVTNAGHPPPLAFRAGAFLELGAPCALLGRFPDARYGATTTELAAGDRIVAYTDGLVEARNTRSEQFGEERLKEIIRRSTERDTTAVADEIVNAVRRWRVEDEDTDDLTIVVIDVG